MQPKPFLRSLRALLLATVAVVAVALLLELALQLGALLVKEQARQVEARWLTGHTRLLALGDSNTYGLYLEAPDAWPAQLEAQWNRAHPDQSIEVLNLGYPGTNSFRVRDNLPALLDKLAPDLVFIMVGFNDFWTPAENLSTTTTPFSQRLKNHSRLYKLYAMWQRSKINQQDMTFGSPRPSENVDPARLNDPSNIEKHLLKMDGENFYMGTLQGEPARNMKALAENLAFMIRTIRARDADVVLLTYPSNWGFYPGANKWLKKSAEDNHVPLIDITPLFIAQCSDGPASCPSLLFHDGHATTAGNALVAGKVLEFWSSYKTKNKTGLEQVH
ncbi:MAG TPA: GDSL-type esterase/lipase family protein [Pseudomonadales bacterium]|nr:GDSL-type esterase/lipase family protein [Pseudomonadales bacterium]